MVGVVEEVGSDVKHLSVGDKVAALLVHGGNGEYLLRPAAKFVRVPNDLDDAKTVALILNYVTAYQMIHRYAKLSSDQTVLVTSASGGVGLALLELLQLMGVKAYAACSEKKFESVRKYGAIPILDSRSGVNVDKTLRKLVPNGVDVSFDGIGGVRFWECVAATKRGGHVIGFGFMGTIDPVTGNVSSFESIRGIVGTLTCKFWGVKGDFYGITADYRKNPKPFEEDLLKLCDLLKEGKIDPIIAARLEFFETKKAQEMLEKGGLTGKIVLVA